MSSLPYLSSTLILIQQKITLYVYPIWLVFGVTGCILDLIIFSRPQLRKSTCSIYFFAASVDHLFTIVTGLGPVVYSINNPNPQIQSLLFCKIRGYLFQIGLMLSRWYVAFACIDRYTFTSDRARLRRFANKKIAYSIIFIVIAVWSIICSHRLIFYEIKGNTCGIVNNMIAALYHSAYVIIGGGVLPAVIMIICTYLIRRNLALKRQRRAELSLPQRQDRSIDHQVLKILFIQIVCYIIFIIPQLGNLVFNTVSLTISDRSQDRLAIEQFISFMAECVLYLFPVTSFYLYTLTSRTFRNELIKIFRLSFIFGKVNQIMPDITVSVLPHRTAIHTKMMNYSNKPIPDRTTVV